jgi:hypothetical protein
MQRSETVRDRLALAMAINGVAMGGRGRPHGTGGRGASGGAVRESGGRTAGVEIEVNGVAWRHSPTPGVDSPNAACGGCHE